MQAIGKLVKKAVNLEKAANHLRRNTC